ncbi:MAG TPA: DUF6468 domain-containing protein, partial [Emcibacteraceae bacterium]|nr:DUF6468 domain-containing protein [Emcibacteraceae bacterium]
ENILNIILLVMLAVMIGYCIVLNKRLKDFRKIKQEMGDIIGQLNASTIHAQNSIKEFKNVVLEEEKKLDEKLKRAAELADELDMINETGSNLADRIERGLTGGNAPQTITEEPEEHQAPKIKTDNLSDRISLSDLDSDKNADGDKELRESLRNVR